MNVRKLVVTAVISLNLAESLALSPGEIIPILWYYVNNYII